MSNAFSFGTTPAAKAVASTTSFASLTPSFKSDNTTSTSSSGPAVTGFGSSNPFGTSTANATTSNSSSPFGKPPAAASSAAAGTTPFASVSPQSTTTTAVPSIFASAKPFAASSTTPSKDSSPFGGVKSNDVSPSSKPPLAPSAASTSLFAAPFAKKQTEDESPRKDSVTASSLGKVSASVPTSSEKQQVTIKKAPVVGPTSAPAPATTQPPSKSVEEHIQAYLQFLEEDRKTLDGEKPPISNRDQKIRRQLTHNLALLARFEEVHKITKAAERLSILETVTSKQEQTLADLAKFIEQTEKQLTLAEDTMKALEQDADQGHLLRRALSGKGGGPSDPEQQRLWEANCDAFQKMFQFHTNRWVRAQEELERRQAQ